MKRRRFDTYIIDKDSDEDGKALTLFRGETLPKIAYVILNGELEGNMDIYHYALRHIKGDIYCADGGTSLARTLEVTPLEVWGDFDSSSIKDVPEGVKIVRFEAEKDATDGELIIDYLSPRYDYVVAIGGTGGRHDHELSNLTLCFRYPNLVFMSGSSYIFNARTLEKIACQPEQTISFIPFSDVVTNITLTGFKYEVKNYDLSLGSSRCQSNIAITETPSITYDSGNLLCILEAPTLSILQIL